MFQREAMEMDKDALWNAFAHSGKVEDYLRYRGVDRPQETVNSVEREESGYGHRPQTASDDRRSDSAGV